MNSNYLLLLLLFITLFHKGFSTTNCTHHSEGNDGNYDCGGGCPGTPSCGKGRTCGNVANMCYCDCIIDICVTSALGSKWNNGIKLANGSYALNGTAGNGKEYKC